MTHLSTWTNSDGLVVGFGPNVPERQASAVAKTYGEVREARLHITYESTLGEAGALIQLPRMTKVLGVEFRVDTAWASGDSGTLSVGHTEADTADVDAFLTASALAAAAMTPAGKVIVGDGAYLADTNSVKIPATLTDDFDDATKGVKVFFTKANNFTAGEGTLVVRYIQLGY